MSKPEKSRFEYENNVNDQSSIVDNEKEYISRCNNNLIFMSNLITFIFRISDNVLRFLI